MSPLDPTVTARLSRLHDDLGLIRTVRQLRTTLQHRFPDTLVAALDLLPESALTDPVLWGPTLEAVPDARYLSLRRFFRSDPDARSPLPTEFIGYLRYDGFRGLVGCAEAEPDRIAELTARTGVLGEWMDRFRSQSFTDFLLHHVHRPPGT